MELANTNSKFFFINRSEIENRFDPEMIMYSRKTNSFIYESIELKRLLKKKPQYGANESGIQRNTDYEPRYIRITDIDENGLLNNTIGVSARVIEDKYVLNNNDILFARSGATVGKAYIHEKTKVNYQCFFAGYMIRFVVNESILLPKFLFTYTQLNIYKSWVKAIQRAAGQPNINAEEFKSLLIPLPPLNIQKQVVKIIDNAYTKKQQKEILAKELLKSIDTYILSELGITIPGINNIPEKRMFIANFSDVVGLRLDPTFFLPNYSILIDKIQNGQFDKLKNIISFSNETWNQNDNFDNKFPYIEISEIDLNSGKINNVSWVPKAEAPSRAKMVVRENDIIVSTTRPDRGAISLITKNENGYIASTGFAVLRNLKRNDINREYLFFILRTQICLLQIQQRTSGGNYPAITTEELKNISIPLLPLIHQKVIVTHIKAIQQQISQLQIEATSILENAKMGVEKMIMG